ncbi:hypothetical protein NL676_009517 [Syzygium grande]|nr:hypothetical protein NL676_009517 [Syzygium grande]
MAKRGSHCGAEGSAAGLEEEGLGYKRISSPMMVPPLGMVGMVEPGSRGKSWCWILKFAANLLSRWPEVVPLPSRIEEKQSVSKSLPDPQRYLASSCTSGSPRNCVKIWMTLREYFPSLALVSSE